MADGVEQAVAEGRDAVVTTEGAVSIEEQSAFVGARIVFTFLVFDAFQIVARRGGEAELGADKIFEDRAVVAADRPVRFVADDELEIGRRKVGEKTVVGREALDGGDDDLRFLPVAAFLFVDDGRDTVRREISREVFLGLFFQLEPVDEKEDAMGIFGAQVELGDGGAEKRFSSARRHFEEEAVFAGQRGLLKRADGGDLVVAEQADLLLTIAVARSAAE